jgi:phenylpyruvate tautomerase PptA (4-oxalocrotonate tautomerase family)
VNDRSYKLATAKVAMPLINVKLIEGVNMRPVTWVIVEEVRSGDWGIAGNPLTTADVKALAAGSPVA